MEDAELVLKELRIDWETVLTDEYNPLKQALEIKRNSIKLSNYRNIYHKVERVMEKIIEVTYKGFSDSVLSYTECYNLTLNGLKDIEEMQSIVDNINKMSINTKDIHHNFQETEYLRIKNKICEDLVELKDKHESYKILLKEGSIPEAVINLQEMRDLIKNKHLYSIKGIDTYGLEIEGNVREVCDEIFSKLDLFIYQNQVEFKEYFRLITVLNRILKYDRFIYSNLEKNIFKSIEEIIHDINKDCAKKYNDFENDKDVHKNDYKNDEYELDYKKDLTTVNYTIKTSDKITCFYNGKPNIHKTKSLKNILVKRIVDKINTIKYNLAFLRQIAEHSFTHLNDEMRDYYAEYKGFMIFRESGEENVNRIIQKVIKTFIEQYTSSDKKDIEVGEFENINILDDINYDEEFDEKYSIHDRITNSKIINEEKEEDFTLIFRPSIDICIDLYEYIREERSVHSGATTHSGTNDLRSINKQNNNVNQNNNINQNNNVNQSNNITHSSTITHSDIIEQRCIKYISQRSEEVFKKVVVVFQEHRWDRNNYATSTLWFTNSFMKIIREVENIMRVFGPSSLESSFDLVKRKMFEKFKVYFPSPVITSLMKSVKNVIVFTDRVDLNPIDWCSMAFNKNQYLDVDKDVGNGVGKCDGLNFVGNSDGGNGKDNLNVSSTTQFPVDLTSLKGLENTDISKFNEFVKVEENGNFKYFVNLPEDVKSKFKQFVVSKSINNKELLNGKYDHILFSINSLIELSIIDLAYQYAFAFKMNIYLEIFFYLDLYYREGIYSDTLYIMKIIKIVQQVYKHIDLSDIFELINYYVMNNRQRLNVKMKEDLEGFIKGLEILDECLSDVSEKCCLKKSIDFVQECGRGK